MLTTRYIQVILPLKFTAPVIYRVDDNTLHVEQGSWVKVWFGKGEYAAVVRRFFCENEVADVIAMEQVRLIEQILEIPPVSEVQMEFWENLAGYYLCTVGEVFKAAYPNMVLNRTIAGGSSADETEQEKDVQDGVAGKRKGRAKSTGKRQELPNMEELRERGPKLSQVQDEAYRQIKEHFENGRRVLLNGVTGSGKTEIYIQLALDAICSNESSVLMLVPEISLSKQLHNRVKSVFGNRLLLYNSKVTVAGKERIQQTLSKGERGFFVLGTRSALLLPFANLSTIIIDEEHDNSYKQDDPAPRYHARDAAMMLSQQCGANLLLGSATPSYESLYNVALGKLAQVNLLEKYFDSACARSYGASESGGVVRAGATSVDVTIIDTIHARFTHQMKGSFSQQLINRMRRCLESGEQVMILKNRRSYAPMVECSECGEPAVCPHCNVNLSYHKSDNTFRCHYCEYVRRFSDRCPKCGNNSLVLKGAGTERVEEELEALFPGVSIGRFDADVTKSKREEERILSEFDNGKIQILVGTQMLTKGFDFKNLKLVAVLGAEQILGLQDFRSDEKAYQMFSQLLGRAGRRGQGGEIYIQTTCKEHPVLQRLKQEAENSRTLNVATSEGEGDVAFVLSQLNMRKDYLFPPYVRLVNILVRDRGEERVEALASRVAEVLRGVECLELTGPFSPQIDRVRGMNIRAFYIKFARNRSLGAGKRHLAEKLAKFIERGNVVVDVDPL